MRGIEIMPRRLAGDEFNRDQMRALMQQLEHRMLGIGAHPAPCHRRAVASKRRALGGHRLAVRFHLQLLKIIGQQAQTFIIGKYRPCLTRLRLGIIQIRKCRQCRGVLHNLGIAEMRVHGGCTIQQFLIHRPTKAKRNRKADGAP